MVNSIHTDAHRNHPTRLAQDLCDLFSLPGQTREFASRVLGEFEELHMRNEQVSQEVAELHAVTNLLREASATNGKLTDQFVQEQVREPLAELLIPIVHDVEAVVASSDEQKILLGFRDRLVDALRSLRVEQIEVRRGEKFDPTRMQCMERRLVTEREANGRVAGVLRSGFSTGSRVVREAVVVLYEYRTTQGEGGVV